MFFYINYRTAQFQFIIVPRDQSSIEREDPKNFMRNVEYGPVFRESFLDQAFKLYDTVLSLKATMGNDTVTLQDICFKVRSGYFLQMRTDRNKFS